VPPARIVDLMTVDGSAMFGAGGRQTKRKSSSAANAIAIVSEKSADHFHSTRAAVSMPS
jgi:hypothetical protein